MTQRDATAAEERARNYLREGKLVGLRLPPEVDVGRAIPVLDARRSFDSWFVPLLAGDSIAGFLQLERSLVLRRASAFGHLLDSRDWLDVERVRERARSVAGLTPAAADPYLGFDGSPDRLAWRCEARSDAGAPRTIFVVGTTAYSRDEAQGPAVD